MNTTTLAILQAVRLKGRTTADDITAATGLKSSAVAAIIAELVEAGQLKDANGRYRLTPEGRTTLQQLLAVERAEVDQTALIALYEEFDQHNTTLKELASAWQVRDGEPNDHGDNAYDEDILERLNQLHREFLPLLDNLVTVVERLRPYPQRFAAALSQIAEGDRSYFLKPVADSYHTVWFEMHEDLIGLLGRTRKDEAAAGRAE